MLAKLSTTFATAAALLLSLAVGCRPSSDPSREAGPPKPRIEAAAEAEPLPEAAGRTAFGGVCRGDAVEKCIARYARSKLTSADIKKVNDEGLGACFDPRDPAALADQGACLPLSLGIDERNGKTVELIYFCSDVCPNYGRIVLRYANTSKEECCAIGAHPKIDGGWGGYIGCSPAEVPLPRFKYSRTPGGPLEPAQRSPCDPAKVIFDDGTIVVDPNIRAKGSRRVFTSPSPDETPARPRP